MDWLFRVVTYESTRTIQLRALKQLTRDLHHGLT